MLSPREKFLKNLDGLLPRDLPLARLVPVPVKAFIASILRRIGSARACFQLLQRRLEDVEDKTRTVSICKLADVSCTARDSIVEDQEVLADAFARGAFASESR